MDTQQEHILQAVVLADPFEHQSRYGPLIRGSGKDNEGCEASVPFVSRVKEDKTTYGKVTRVAERPRRPRRRGISGGHTVTDGRFFVHLLTSLVIIAIPPPPSPVPPPLPQHTSDRMDSRKLVCGRCQEHIHYRERRGKGAAAMARVSRVSHRPPQATQLTGLSSFLWLWTLGFCTQLLHFHPADSEHDHHHPLDPSDVRGRRDARTRCPRSHRQLPPHESWLHGQPEL